MGGLAARVERKSPEWVWVGLSGVIDERADLDGIFAALRSDAIIDLAEVRRINSPGVLRWIETLRKFTSEFRLRIERVSYPMAVQAACVLNLFPGAEVSSCLAPYYCPSCEESLEILVTVSELATGTPPRKTCTDCGSELDFDELDIYFTFLAPTA